jgi:hypothetical protein
MVRQAQRFGERIANRLRDRSSVLKTDMSLPVTVDYVLSREIPRHGSTGSIL